MEAITVAYQGFAKQNYTMLDNLKLGYGGTKTEMERLLKDAQKITGIKYDINNLSDVYQAIHVIQGELGITGTTAKESAETLTGSMATLKASWENFLSGAGDIEQVIDSAEVALQNLSRIATDAISYISGQIGDLLKEKLEPLTKWIDEHKNALIVITGILATLTTAIIAHIVAMNADLIVIWAYVTATSIATAVSSAFGAVLAFITSPITLVVLAIGALITIIVLLVKNWDTVKEKTLSVWESVKNTVSKVINAIIEWFKKIIDFVKSNWQGILLFIASPFAGAFKLLYDNCEGFRNVVNQFLENIKQFFISVGEWFKNLPYNIGYHIGLILGKILQFGNNMWNWITQELPQIINSIVDWFSQLPNRIWEWLLSTLLKIGFWAIDVYNTATAWISNTVDGIINWFKQLPGRIWAWLVNTINKIIEFGKNMANKGKEGATNLFNNIVNTIKELPNKMLEMGKNIVEGLWNGIKNAANWIKEKVGNFASGILDGMKEALGIHSPSTLFRDQVGKNIALGVGEGFEDNISKVYRQMKSAVDFETQKLSTNLSTTAMMSKVITANININGNVDMDGTKVGRLVAPSVSRTLRTAGA